MSSPFVAEIRIFPFNFNPRGWAFCNGQTLAISQNTALFSLVGTNYGGDGRTTFGLPNLQGSFPVGYGQGAGLSQYTLGQTGGTATVTLTNQMMPSHTHSMNALAAGGTAQTPGGNFLTQPILRTEALYGSDANTAALASAAVASTGGGGAHNNLPSYLALSYCIAMQGVFPPRS